MYVMCIHSHPPQEWPRREPPAKVAALQMGGGTEMMKLARIGVIAAAPLVLAACAPDADIASRNLSRAADMFEIDRRVVFYNGITGDFMLTIEGRCSLGNNDKSREVTITCKTGDGNSRSTFSASPTASRTSSSNWSRRTSAPTTIASSSNRNRSYPTSIFAVTPRS